jgi:PKHD-type hydroxylase
MIENETVILNSNNKFCSVLTSDFLNEKQVESIKKNIIEDLWTTGEVENGKINKDLRSVKQQVAPMSPEGWPFNKIMEFVLYANKERFKFNIGGFLSNDFPIIKKYEVGGHYDWHIDTGNSFSNRKLSFSIQLSDSNDYEGGDLEFLNSVTKKEDLRKKGCIIIFPSFLAHKITPVTKGTRLSLVGWIHGETYK